MMKYTLTTVLLWIADEALVADANGSMHLHVTLAVQSARVAGARVDALLLVAGLVVGAVRVLRALWYNSYKKKKQLIN